MSYFERRSEERRLVRRKAIKMIVAGGVVTLMSASAYSYGVNDIETYVNPEIEKAKNEVKTAGGDDKRFANLLAERGILTRRSRDLAMVIFGAPGALILGTSIVALGVMDYSDNS